MNSLIFAFWFFLPAGLANAAPPIANKIPGLNKWQTPLDFGHKLGGKPLFGPNKTWRGLVSGVFVAGLVGFLINRLAPNASFALFNSFGFAWMGLGALLGDALESAIKRRVGVQSGDSWFPFDQIDYIVGGLLFALFIVHLQFSQTLSIFIIYFGLHLITSYLGYLLKFKDKPI